MGHPFDDSIEHEDPGFVGVAADHGGGGFDNSLGGDAGLTFRMQPNRALNSVLDQNITVNGELVGPVYRFEGKDATTSAWVDAASSYSFAINGSGNEVTAGAASIFGDTCVEINKGKHYVGADNDTGQITDEDFCFEFIFRHPYTGSLQIWAKQVAGVGYVLTQSSANLLWSIGDGTDTLNQTITESTPGAWTHLMIFCDRSSTQKVYVNGVLTDTGDPTSVDSMEAAGPLYIGASSGGSACDTSLQMVSMWAQDSWFNGDTDWLSTAKERFFKIAGLYPQHFLGTPEPRVWERTAYGHIEVADENGNIALDQVSRYWPRVVDIIDSNGDTLTGVSSEIANENKFLYSWDLTNAAWSFVDAGDSWTESGARGPNLTKLSNPTLDLYRYAAFRPDSTDGVHSFTQAVTVTAASWCASMYVRRVNSTWARIYNTTTSSSVWFDLSTGTIGTETNCTGGIYPLRGSWYRIWMVFTGTAASHTIGFGVTDADNDTDYSGGSGAERLRCKYAQLQLGNFPTSTIYTGAAAASNAKDILDYKMDDGNLENNRNATLACQFHQLAVPVNGGGDILGTTDGGSLTDRTWIATDTSGNIDAYTRAADGDNCDIAGSTVYADDTIHDVRFVQASNDAELLVDTVSTGTDTDMDAPNDQDELKIGMSAIETSQPNAVIGDIRVFRKKSLSTPGGS
jgi:hypothetical protein